MSAAAPAAGRFLEEWTDVQNGWSDVVVTAPEVPAFRFWATGHLENGQPSISSPFRL